MISTRLTKRLLLAMEEALIFRMAGELGSEALPAKDYDDALDWIAHLQAARDQVAALNAPFQPVKKVIAP